MGINNSPLILYVEDNADNRLLVRRILMAEGFQVVEAANGEEALKLIQQQTPDLILMDISMPDMDGYTLTRRLKIMPHLERVPIIALTAHVMKGDRERSLEAGCDGYIQKPVNVDRLGEQIRSFLQPEG